MAAVQITVQPRKEKLNTKQKSQLEVASNVKPKPIKNKVNRPIATTKKRFFHNATDKPCSLTSGAARATNRQMCQSLHNHNGG